MSKFVLRIKEVKSPVHGDYRGARLILAYANLEGEREGKRVCSFAKPYIKIDRQVTGCSINWIIADFIKSLRMHSIQESDISFDDKKIEQAYNKDQYKRYY